MKKVLAAAFVLGMAAPLMGCPGSLMKCKFNEGSIYEKAGDARAFLQEAHDLKVAADELEKKWNEVINNLGVKLEVVNPNEDNVLAKINLNIQEIKVQGKCEVTFEANMEAGADASAGASAGTGGAAAGAGASAYAKVDVKFDAKCTAEASVKAKLELTTVAIKTYYPDLLGIVVRYKTLKSKIESTIDAGKKLTTSLSKDPLLLNEVNCAIAAATNIKVEARVSFSVKASASARGEAKA